MEEKSKRELSVKMSESTRQAINCVAQHICIFLNQSAGEKKADLGEPCETCRYVETCNFDWISKMKPLLELSDIRINLVDQAQRDTPDSDHMDPDLGKGTCRNVCKSSCPSYNQEP